MLLFHSIRALLSFWEFGMAAEMVLLSIVIGLALGLLVSLPMKKKAA